jgi:hypothetical protein
MRHGRRRRIVEHAQHGAVQRLGPAQARLVAPMREQARGQADGSGGVHRPLRDQERARAGQKARASPDRPSAAVVPLAATVWLSNRDWALPSDPEARIAKLKDGRTHLADKPEHAVDLDTGAIVAAESHLADQGDTTTLPATLDTAEANLAAVEAAPSPEDPAELVADKGYHARDGLKALADSAWKSRIAEKKVAGVHRWHGDDDARRAVDNNRARLRSGMARKAFKLRAECVGAASPCSSTVAACGVRGSAAGRTCASATSCTWPATISG